MKPIRNCESFSCNGALWLCLNAGEEGGRRRGRRRLARLRILTSRGRSVEDCEHNGVNTTSGSTSRQDARVNILTEHAGWRYFFSP
jgi:hypothetical protein